MSFSTFDQSVFRAALDLEKVVVLSDNPPHLKMPELTDAHIQAFIKHAELIVEANKKVNLTAITDAGEMAVKHYLDSLTCCLAVDFAGTQHVCDVGSGAGFPGIPLAIVFPQTHFVLLEATQKKAAFLTHAINELGLNNCEVLADRAETAGRGPLREAFDVVIGRGVSKLSVLAEYCLPLTRVGGQFIALRGKTGADKAIACKDVLCLLGGGETSLVRLNLTGAGERSLIIMSKNTTTYDKYPRRPGMPEKKPL
jgi:16S rRNA (guanine527-N7)-methyltransferase